MLDQLPTLTEQTRTTALSLEQITFEEACRTEAARTMALAERRPLTLVEQKELQARPAQGPPSLQRPGAGRSPC